MVLLGKRMIRFFASPRLAVYLLVYLGVFILVGTLIPQAGLDSDTPIKAFLAVPTVDATVSALGLYEAFSSPAFLLPVAVLFVNTCVCTYQRIVVARKRQRFCARTTAGGDNRAGISSAHALGVTCDGQPMTDDDKQRISSCLADMGFKRVHVDDTRVCGFTSLWALYASSLFHILLAVLIAVVLCGRLTRYEAVMTVPFGPGRAITQSNVDIDTQGPLYRFTSSPDTLLLIDMHEDYVLNGQSRGIAAELAVKTAQGRIAKRQMTYVNQPLSRGSLLVHIIDQGFGLHFTFQDTVGTPLSSRVDFTCVSDFKGELTPETAHRLFDPFRIALDNPDTPYLAVHLMPSIVEGQIVSGKKEDAYCLVYLTDAKMNQITPPEVLGMGQSFEVPGIGSVRFDSMERAVLVKLVDDWSVPVLYVLATLATITLSIALLFSPRLCAVFCDRETGELTCIVRIYRPYALDVAQVEQRLKEAFTERA